MIKTYFESTWQLWPHFVQLSCVQNTRLKARCESGLLCTSHSIGGIGMAEVAHRASLSVPP